MSQTVKKIVDSKAIASTGAPRVIIVPFTSFVDKYGIYHTFPTRKDYEMYLAESNIESLAR